MIEYSRTTSGAVLHLRHVPTRLVFEIAARHEIPGPPTYTVTTAGGGERDFAHDETTLESPEDERAWEVYQAARKLAEFQQQKEVNAFLIDVCIIDDPPPLESWSIQYSDWGLTAPDIEDRRAYKRRWIEEEVCSDPKDFLTLLVELYKLSGLQEDRIRAIESFFRLALEGAIA